MAFKTKESRRPDKAHFTEGDMLRQEVKILRQEVRYLKAMLEDSNKDAMTDLGSRNALIAEFPKILSSALRMKMDLSLVIIDLDGLKKTNDTHGHIAGDNLIRAAAKSIKNSLRTEDFSYRYGGDEFLILAYAEHERSVASMLERLGRNMLKNNVLYSAGFSTIKQFIGPEHKVRVTEESAAEVRDLMIKAADEMMYAKKREKKRQS